MLILNGFDLTVYQRSLCIGQKIKIKVCSRVPTWTISTCCGLSKYEPELPSKGVNILNPLLPITFMDHFCSLPYLSF